MSPEICDVRADKIAPLTLEMSKGRLLGPSHTRRPTPFKSLTSDSLPLVHALTPLHVELIPSFGALREPDAEPPRGSGRAPDAALARRFLVGQRRTDGRSTQAPIHPVRTEAYRSLHRPFVSLLVPPAPLNPSGVLPNQTVTTAVTLEALSDPQTSAILTYHPPIFSGLKSLRLSGPGTSLQASLLNCIADGVPVFCVHTAADNCVGGTNDFIAQGLLGADAGSTVRPIEVVKDPPVGHERAGAGRIVEFVRAVDRAEIVRRYKKVLGLQHCEFRWSRGRGCKGRLTFNGTVQAAWASEGPELISTAAICAGSGASRTGAVEGRGVGS